MIDERRDYTVELSIEERGEAKTPVLVGYASVFGKTSVDHGGFTEEVARGAFAETIAKDDVVALVDHEPTRILGRKSAGTLRLSEDEAGLRMEIDVPDTTIGRDLVTNVKRGDIKGASFAFRTITDDWRMQDGKAHRTLIKVTVRDVGPVTFPAYNDTSVAMRALAQRSEVEQSKTAGRAIRVRKQRQAEAEAS